MKKYFGGYRVRVNDRVAKAWGELFPDNAMTTFRFSTSIQNFADRVSGRHGVDVWHPVKSLFDPTVFVGLYHEGDWSRFILHRGHKLAFWCGGDILRLKEKPLWQWLIRQVDADHVCENEVEQKALCEMGIFARIHPILFFDPVENFPLSFKPSERPHVWLTCHPGREREYGVELVEEIADKVPEVTFHIFGIGRAYLAGRYIPYLELRSEVKNIIYHGQVPSEQLDVMIKDYQCGLRTCEFDGCSHVTTKGTLLGQWSITRIKYPFNDHYETKEELVELLKKLKHKTKPNLAGREYWLPLLSKFPWS